MRRVERALRTGGLALLVAACAWSSTALASPELEAAKKLVGDLKYREAEKALETAWKLKGNSREDVLSILELQGIVAAYLNKPPQAARAFLLLQSLDPTWRISDDQPPRVTTPWYEARGRAADTGPLTMKAAGSGVAVELTDPPGLADKVRFHTRTSGGWQQADVKLSDKRAALEGGSAGSPWWAEALNDNEGVLLVLGSEAKPLGGRGDAPVAQTAPPTPAPTPAPVSAVATTPAPAQATNPVRIVGVVVGVAGLGGLVGALISGLNAGALRQQIQTAARDGAGNVAGMTQAEAATLDAQMKSAATVSNVLWVSGGVLAGAGLVMIIVGGPRESASVALGPTAGGLQVSGAF